MTKLRLSSLFIFFLALAIRLWYNFATQHVNAAFAWDAAEYFRDAVGFEKVATLPLTFWSDACRLAFGSLPATQAEFVHQQLSPLKELCQGGPIFPLFILISFKLCGAQLVSTNTFPPLFMYCVLTSLTCVFIALIGETLWDKLAGMAAGILASLYPAFIVNSGRLYSESLATMFVCAIILLLSRAASRCGLSSSKALLLGILAACLHVTRSVMAVISLALLPITLLIAGDNRKKKLALYVIGFVLIFAPWLFLQKCVVGKSSFVVDRLGHYNLYIGNNVDTFGWLVFPYPEYGNIVQESPLHILKRQIQKSPQRWFQLMLNKPARLLATPWNDFKVDIGPISPANQILFHQFLLLWAAIGVISSLLEKTTAPGNRGKLYARLGVLAFFLFHFIYCAFITMSRYALSSMPCVILFAAAAITAICRHQFTLRRFRAYLLTFASVLVFLFVAATNFSIALTNLAGENWLIVMTVLQSLLRLGVYAAVIFLCLRFALCLNMPQRATVALALTLFFLAAPQVCLPLRIYGRWYEWKQAFNQKGTIVAQTIRLSDERIKQMSLRQSYVIIDLENGAFTANDIRVRMNGVPLDSFNIPIMSLASDGRNNMALPNGTVCPEIEYILNDIVFFTGGFPEQLRQWYLLPIGADQLARALAVGESKGIAKNTMIITLEKLSDNANAIYGAYRTDPRFLLIPSVTQFSWEKGFCGLENPDGFTDFALDTKIGLPVEKGENEVTSRDAVSQPPNPFVRILVSPPVAGAHSGLLELTGDSKLSQLVAPAHGITAADTAVAACGRADALKVIRFSADLDAKPGSPDLSVGVIAQLRKLDGAPLLYPSKWCPQIVSAKSPTTHLDFSFPIAPGCLSARLTGLTATLASVDYFQTPNVLSTDVGGVERNLRFRIYDLPNNPISAGHEIY